MVRKTVPDQQPGGSRTATHGGVGQGGEVAGDLSGDQIGLVGLPETLGGRRQLVAGRPLGRLWAEHFRPGGLHAARVDGRANLAA